ncbi:hypothetical protein JAAARDRAFT_198831 [Jaapia argillacea MUCL 33604]|uniref:Uncharacterized protein n=1 Tax=Jaapia argillacea MUCL 33604 TaxID=933084 RepID=A0A067PD34_9AGAM|nr:hypothetical protein JAAARDRAFT_198831 [Jaapia argillacea MUCL 33604]
MPESDRASVVSAGAFSDSDISSIDDRHPDEVWDCVTDSPRMHSIVVFSTNPTATVDYLFGQDVSDALNTDSLPRRFFVGFVERTYSLPSDNNPFTKCRIYFIAQDLPSPCIKNGRESSMCTPLWPTTEHPSGRKPIRLREPLPWENCYLHSTSYVDVRVLPAEFEDAKIRGVMLFPEVARHREFRNEDQARMLVEENPVADGERDLLDPTLVHGQAECEDIEDVASSQGSHEEFTNFLLGTMCAEPSDSVIVDMTYDLSEVSSLLDPLEFFEEEKALRKLAQGFVERKEALEAEEEAVWAREMKEEQERMLAANSHPAVHSPPELNRKPSPKRNLFNLLRAFTYTRERLRPIVNKLSLSTPTSSSCSLPRSEGIAPETLHATWTWSIHDEGSTENPVGVGFDSTKVEASSTCSATTIISSGAVYHFFATMLFNMLWATESCTRHYLIPTSIKPPFLDP